MARCRPVGAADSILTSCRDSRASSGFDRPRYPRGLYKQPFVLSVAKRSFAESKHYPQRMALRLRAFGATLSANGCLRQALLLLQRTDHDQHAADHDAGVADAGRHLLLRRSFDLDRTELRLGAVVVVMRVAQRDPHAEAQQDDSNDDERDTHARSLFVVK